MTTRALMSKLEGTWASNAIAVAEQLSIGDPTSKAQSLSLAGGHLVLSGPGLYVNRALAFGLDRAVTEEDFGIIEALSGKVGVPASLDILPLGDPMVLELATRRGYISEMVLSVLGMRLEDPKPANPKPGNPNPEISITEATGHEGLVRWQEICAKGWGHDSLQARRASDTYSAAAFGVGETLLVAESTRDARPLGCAVLVQRNKIATLGGMSTLPSERRQGVQTALVHHRLDLARRAGCNLAVTSAAQNGDSARNLARLGFEHLYTKEIWTTSAS